jgi:hypothetical protein
MLARRVAKRLQPYRQLGATVFEFVIAADLANGGGYETYSPFVSRIEPVINYDFEPGVIVRCYWCPP